MKNIVGLTAGVAVGAFVAPKMLEMTGATANGPKLAITIVTIALTAWAGLAVTKALF